MEEGDGDDTKAKHGDDVPKVAAAAAAQIIRLEDGAGQRPTPPLPRE